MGVFVQVIVWIAGFYFVCDGFYMEYKVQSAMQQQVSSIYIVGGVMIIALAIIIHRLGRISEDLSYAATKITKS
ncbi:hypothetical protein G6L14_02090 [Agrobacterium vitis]|uniref:hypothetical protein n=1 Tax=Agrobacterium vitis TaxID=373 RepID=UPI0015721F0D|nr:hypothetical protein [Agrobacterium vitis]NSY10805.1 hypothetical protein [Agrobacterium vitis]